MPVSLTDPFDVLTIAAITDELSATIGNGRVQRIGLVDARTIGAEIYAAGRRNYLIASADDRRPRLRLAAIGRALDGVFQRIGIDEKAAGLIGVLGHCPRLQRRSRRQPGGIGQRRPTAGGQRLPGVILTEGLCQ